MGKPNLRLIQGDNKPKCKNCGKLLPYTIDKDYKGGKRGYDGVNPFCTLRCGYKFGVGALKAIKDGHLVASAFYKRQRRRAKK